MVPARRIVMIAALSLAAPAMARAQSASEPMMPPAVALPLPTIGDSPHLLRGNPLVGAAIAIGLGGGSAMSAGADSNHVVALDLWGGVGVSDRIAVLGFAEVADQGYDRYFSASAGARVWPAARLPYLSLEARLGLDRRDRSGASDPGFGDTPAGNGVHAGAAVVVDLVRTPRFGLEMRTALAGALVGGEHVGMVTVGLGASVY
jgi:hypothetical protein